VKVYYDLGEGEQTKQVTMIPNRGEHSARVEFMLPKDELEYDYEVAWRLRGGETVSSGRRTTSDAVLFVDELP